jgi:MbtH protein
MSAKGRRDIRYHVRRGTSAGIPLEGSSMFQDERDDTATYRVVVNHEEQYSIWPVDRELPLGWRDGGKVGPKSECLSYINEVWTDMRPLSLRKKMAADTVPHLGESQS